MLSLISLHCWAGPPGSDQEILSRQELIEKFNLEDVNKSSAVFNFNEKDPREWTDPKVLWMNGEYLRAMPLEELVELVAPKLKDAGLWRESFEAEERDWLLKMVDMLRARYRTTV